MDSACMSQHKVHSWYGGRAVKKKKKKKREKESKLCQGFLLWSLHSAFPGFSQVVKCYMRCSWPNNQLHHSKLWETPFIWWNKKKCESVCLYISDCKCSFWGKANPKWNNFLETDKVSKEFTWISLHEIRKTIHGFTNMIEGFFFHLFCSLPFFFYKYNAFCSPFIRVFFPPLWCLFGSLPSGFSIYHISY